MRDAEIAFIDWMSPSDHANFNEAFFSSLQLRNAALYVFDEHLRNEHVPTHVLQPASSRWRLALQVLALAWRLRGKTIFFLTYDPLFLPLISFWRKRTVVFEHNTTPENGVRSKHGVWQFMFMRSVLRLTQFPAQAAVLKQMRQHVAHVGSPVCVRSLRSARAAGKYFVAPSFRASLESLNRLENVLAGHTVLVKSAVAHTIRHTPPSIKVQPVERIRIDEDHEEIWAVLITVDSRVRGTGWFNDAISYALPVVTLTKSASELFAETFPGYPFIDCSAGCDNEAFWQRLLECAAFDVAAYVARHRAAFAQAFHEALAGPEAR